MKRWLHIVLLSYDGRPELDVSEFIHREVHELAKAAEFSVSYSSVSGCSMLPHARNTAVSEFMGLGASDLIFIDSDNYTGASGFAQLMKHDVDVVGAPCRAKKLDVVWPVRWLTDRPIKKEANGLIEVESVGTGIMRITRKCLDGMTHAHRHNWYWDKWAKSGKAWPIFEYRVVDHRWEGEDVKFCLDWRTLGGQVWIDPDITTHHIGKFTFSGCIGESLEQMPPKLSVTRESVAVQNELSKVT